MKPAVVWQHLPTERLPKEPKLFQQYSLAPRDHRRIWARTATLPKPLLTSVFHYLQQRYWQAIHQWHSFLEARMQTRLQARTHGRAMGHFAWRKANGLVTVLRVSLGQWAFHGLFSFYFFLAWADKLLFKYWFFSSETTLNFKLKDFIA